MMYFGRGPRLFSYEDEAENMLSPKGLFNTSCTLLVYNPQGERQVGLYKPSGLLFNANTAQIQHISKHDSHSGCETDGTLMVANEFKVDTLDELVNATIETDLLEFAMYNELNAIFRMDDLEGLFLSIKEKNKEAPDIKRMRATMRIIQKLFENKYHIHLPIMVYHLETGELKPLDSKSARTDISWLVQHMFNGQDRRSARDQLFSLLGI